MSSSEESDEFETVMLTVRVTFDDGTSFHMDPVDFMDIISRSFPGADAELVWEGEDD